MTRTPSFGTLLKWRVVTPGEEHATTYNGRDWHITFTPSRVAREGPRVDGWALDLTPETGAHPCDPDRDWPYGFPLGRRVAWAHLVAELRLACPWLLPTMTSDAPSLLATLAGHGTGWPTAAGPVSCRLVDPRTHLVEVCRGNESGGPAIARIRPRIDVPDDPATAPIAVRWLAHRDGEAVSAHATWPEAFVAATAGEARPMPRELSVGRRLPPDDADPDSYGCGYEYDHDIKVTHEDVDGTSWLCRRCDAEGWSRRPRQQGDVTMAKKWATSIRGQRGRQTHPSKKAVYERYLPQLAASHAEGTTGGVGDGIATVTVWVDERDGYGWRRYEVLDLDELAATRADAASKEA